MPFHPPHSEQVQAMPNDRPGTKMAALDEARTTTRAPISPVLAATLRAKRGWISRWAMVWVEVAVRLMKQRSFSHASRCVYCSSSGMPIEEMGWES